jgi:glyoxylase-like metal-dependent hydrolase (beta-lactamase superfamily II)
MTALVGHFRVGDLTITHVADGVAVRPRANWFHGADPTEWVPALGIEDAASPITSTFGGFLVTDDGHTTLVDTGIGTTAAGDPTMRHGGGFLDRLRELGVQPENVDRIVQTHLHPDHCGHLATPDGGLTFPSAEIWVHEREIAYWTGEKSDGHRLSGLIRKQIAPLLGAPQLRPLSGDTRLSPSMRVIAAPGHTPGHCVVQVSSRGEHALLVGDLVHHPVHFEHPEWTHRLEFDRDQTAKTRASVADLAIDLDAVVTAPHLPILTLGRLRRTATGVRYEPIS